MRKKANSPAAMTSANNRMRTYSELARSRTAKSELPARVPSGSINSRGAPVSNTPFATGSFPSASGRRADDALQQIVHLVEEGIEVVVGLIDHDLAGRVVLERPDVDRLLRLEPFDGGERRLLGGIGRG